ncbi:MAG: hypothetical protein PHW10_01690 [Candidatus Peribacteraceae bacterium]|nr:hypothetical protein [Candidatus Peribacteraceae bacterium]
MKRKKAEASQQPFVEEVRRLEERLYGGQLNEEDRSMMKSERYFWHFRPSHHAATGLLTQEDIALLSQPDRRLLSVGAYPAFLERLLPELGVPRAHILLADKDPAIMTCADTIEAVTFDLLDPWPEIGTFDHIIFPESLCIAISDRMREEGKVPSGDRSASDAEEARYLAAVLKQALRRLRPGGVIRANGPMSHPNVFRLMGARLEEDGFPIVVESRRFFLSVRGA